KEFAKEAEYLDFVYKKMLKSRESLDAFVKEAREEGLTFVQKMSEDVRVDFSSFSDNMDTFSTIEMKNREIDQMNSRIISAEKLLENVKRSLDAPYFGKVDVDFLDDEEAESFYIGINSFDDDNYAKFVYDWRSPIAELFYNNTTGESAYEVNGNTIEVEIDKRRQFVIDKDTLLKFFDTSVSIQDDVLLEALEQDSSSLMQDITSTIQSEQNVIIRDTRHPIILVNGVAGSGKTSTIMQRIAYLLYSYRKEITSDNILILSPNEHFVSYISNVLPSLGEKTPLNMTLLQFVGRHLSMELEDEQTYFNRISSHEVPKQTEIIRSASFIDFINESEELILQHMDFFNPVLRKDKEIVSTEKIIKAFEQTPDSSPLIARIQATRQLLSSNWERRMTKLAQKPKVIDRVMSLPETLQQKFFNELISDDSPQTINKYAKRYVQIQYSQVTRDIRGLAWFNLQGIFEKIYFAYSQEVYQFNPDGILSIDEAVAFIYIYNRFIEKLSLTNMRFVLVDEVQDYTEAQIRLLVSLFPKSAFTMVGDENQAIFNANIKFQDIINNFSARSEKVELYQLVNSYRSSGSITRLFNRLATNNDEWEIIPIRPAGNEPKIIKVDNQADYLKLLEAVNQELDGKALTLITKTMVEAEELEQSFGQELLDRLNLTIIPISLSKGLEFDNVLIHNASNEHYHSQRDKRILYTASSRAMKNLFITYEDQLTEFLQS
ncbi:MAG: RNA polymerase recycling motor HelD, partial [Ruoffia tabacinasalis]